MQGFLVCGVCFAKNASKVGPYFQILTLPYSNSINRSTFASNSKQAW
jgi:hypothetical protein